VGSAASSLRFGFASCQNYSSGYYTAHANLAQEDLDLCFHLGDYIYEGAGSGVRSVPGGEATTLAGYRNRYALYKSDVNLQAVHHRFPWIVTWDDHEVDNNYAGSVSEVLTVTEAEFLLRRAEAYQAWWEHQPVRMPAPLGADLQIYRGFAWGTLASMFVLDTRQYRSDQVCEESGPVPLSPICADNDDASRTMLGSAQEQWLADRLGSSAARWNVLAQQVVMSATPLVGRVNQDQWDGYDPARQRLLDVLGQTGVANPLVLTGDIHASGAGRLLSDFANPESAVVGHELVGTSISSTFPAGLDAVFNDAVAGLPWAVYANATKRGYVTVDMTPESTTASWRVVDTVAAETSPVRTDFTWVIDAEGGDSTPGGGTTAPVTATPRFTG
jgi:alkaline phosphatase D